MLTAVVVEDVYEEGMRLQEILKDLQSDLFCIQFPDAEGALQYLEESQRPVDLFFLDRELPGMSGFEMAKRIRAIELYELIPIVFVTGFAMNQLDAFQEYHCYSYILKPFSKAGVEQQIGTLIRQLAKRKRQRPFRKAIDLLSRDGEAIVLVEDILCLEMVNRDCKVCLADTSYLISRRSLEKQLDEIQDPYFVRCHKSFAVNLAQVLRIEKERRNLWSVVFRGGQDPAGSSDSKVECVISITYYDAVVKRFREYLHSRKRQEDQI